MTTNPTPRRRKTGRPTKLTPELQEKIVNAVRAGNYLQTACTWAGVHYGTAWRWMSEAEQPGADKAKIAFRDAVNRARAESEMRVIGHIQKVIMGGQLLKETTRTLPNGTTETERQFAPPDGRVALEFASRAYPERWGRRAALEVTGEGGGPVRVEHTQVLASIAERLHAQLAAGEEPDVLQGEIVQDE